LGVFADAGDFLLQQTQKFLALDLAQRLHGLAAIFVADVCAVLQGIDPAKAGLAAGLRGPLECWALWRAAATNAGVSWGDLRKDTVPPGPG